MESKEQFQRPPPPPPPPPPPRRRLSRTLIIVLATLFALIVIALAVGLGVGLTRNHSMGAGSSSASSSSSSSSSTSTMSPVPTSSITPSANGIYQPPVNASWQIILLAPLALDLTSSTVEPNADVWDIDMFTNSNETISHLHALGKHVVCYFSAGSYEPSRPDSSQFNQATDLGNELAEWPGERWLNLNSQNVRNIMTSRIQLAASKGCDAIDPDNVDGYANSNNGLNLQPEDSINFINFLSDTAAQYNMSVGLKNAQGIIPQVLSKTAFSVNEQCAQFGECSAFKPYIDAGKPVFHIEYPKGSSTNTEVAVSIDVVNSVCVDSGKAAGSYNFSTVIKNMNLNGWVQDCSGATAETPCQTSGGKVTGYSTASDDSGDGP